MAVRVGVVGVGQSPKRKAKAAMPPMPPASPSGSGRAGGGPPILPPGFKKGGKVKGKK